MSIVEQLPITDYVAVRAVRLGEEWMEIRPGTLRRHGDYQLTWKVADGRWIITNWDAVTAFALKKGFKSDS